MGRIAKKMKVVPGTATTMVKSLEESDWVYYEPRKGVRLTNKGRQLAIRVLRKHRIVEMFLVKVLDLDWTEINEEAELLEHAVSDKLVERMDQFLGHPSVDPHGDPIPSPTGKLEKSRLVALNEAAMGAELEVSRITRQDGEFLQYIHDNGLIPGTMVSIERKDAMADLLEVQIEGKSNTLSIGGTPASDVWVTERIGEDEE